MGRKHQVYDKLETDISYFEIWIFCVPPFCQDAVTFHVATIISTIPLGNLWTKEPLFDNNNGNRMT